PQFIGNPIPKTGDLAQRIAECVGPSGTNWEYLYRLHKALQDVLPEGVQDDHIEDLWARVEKLIPKEEVDKISPGLVHPEPLKTEDENEEDERKTAKAH